MTRPPVAPTPPRWDIDYASLARDLRPLASETRLRLLNFLTTPHYLEEVSSFLGVNRFAAKKHLDQLVEAGVASKSPAKRDVGVVMEYAIVPERLFEVFDAMRGLGTLKPVRGEMDPAARATRTKASDDAGPALRGAALDARFVVMYGIDVGTVIPVEVREGGLPLVIGRDAECAVRLRSDPFASGRHAHLERRSGRRVVVDLYSKNGTLLDWERLTPGEARPIENGQVLSVGKTLLLFRDR